MNIKKLLYIPVVILSIFALSSCSLFKISSDNDNVITNSDGEIVETTSTYTDALNKVYYSCFGVRNITSSTTFSIGSCVCIKKDDTYSYFLTNRHVIEASDNTTESSNLQIYFGGGYYKAAELLYTTSYNERVTSEASDLALLRMKNTSSDYTVNPITISEENIIKGTEVIAVGCPVSLTYFNTVTTGVVSKLLTSINFVQHTATINPGNSGGGLFNLNGELVGLNVSKREQDTNGSLLEDQNFAISISRIKLFLARYNFEL